MALPINAAAPTFAPPAPLSTLAFHNQAYAGHPGFFCQRCVDYANTISSLRTRVATLDVQLLNAEKKKTEAEDLARHLLRHNEAAMNEATATDTADLDIELRRSLFLANSEKDCMKIMLERAWKKIADLSISDNSKSGSNTTLAKDVPQDPEDLLLDLLGPSELPITGRCVRDLCSFVRPDELNEVEEIESITNPTDGEEVEVLVQENAKLEPDDRSDTYIFHFVRESNKSNDSRDENESVMMKEMASIRVSSHNATCEPFCTSVGESQSESLTAVNSANSSPVIKDASLTELPSTQLTEPKWPFQPGPVWSCDIPTIIGDSIHAPSIGRTKTAGPAVKLEDEHNSVPDAISGRIEYPVPLYDSRQELDDTIYNYKTRVSGEAKRLPDFFQHGLQFNPPPGSWNVFRTLVISNLPLSATMTGVLEKIRGGVVLDAKLLDTLSITGGKTALVTFLHERAAKALQVYLKQHPISIDNRLAHVTVLKTPTWPISRKCEKALFDGGDTRCLEVSRYPRHISPRDLRRYLRLCTVMTLDRIEHMNLGEDDVLALRFESTACAADARGILTSHYAFRACAVRFVPDPCAQPLRVMKAGELGHKIREQTLRDVDHAKEKGRLSKVEWKCALRRSKEY